MKLKTSIFLTTLATLGVISSADAGSAVDMYAGMTIGAGAQTAFADNQDRTNTAQSFGAMFGVDIPMFRVEAEYNYLTTANSHSNVALANVYFKMPSTVIKPYLGLGIGLNFNGEDTEYATIKYDTTTAYQAMLGVTLGVPALPFKFDVEARALYLPDVYKIANVSPDILQYEGRVKIRYIF